MTKTLLAVECSRRDSEVALWKGPKQVDITRVPEGRSAGADLVPLVAELLERNGIEDGNISEMALHVGPGSATGLRMGIALAQGFGFAEKCPRFHAIPLEALVRELLFDSSDLREDITLLADAQGGQVFQLIYRPCDCEAKWCWEGGLQLLDLNDAKKKLEGNVYVFPSVFSSRIRLPENCNQLDLPQPGARHVALAARRGGFATSFRRLDVRYLKRSSAEINYQKKQEAEVKV